MLSIPLKNSTVLLLVLLLAAIPALAKNNSDSLITHRLIYRSAKAGQVYLVWGTNFWSQPDARYISKGSTLHGKSASTLMLIDKDQFSAELKLPKGSRLDYYFKITKNKRGKKVKGYDSNGGNSYFSVAGHDETIVVNDTGLKIYKEPFSVARKSKYLLFFACALLTLSFAVSWKQKKVQLNGLVPAYWLAATAIILLARADITGLGLNYPGRLLAASLQDAFQMMFIGMGATLLLLLFRKNRIAIKIITGFTLFVLLGTVVVSIINIEVVKQLGTPFNYKWLYYSDFLQEGDTNKGAAQTLTPNYIRQVVYLLASFIISGFALHYVAARMGQSAIGKWAFGVMYFALPLFCLPVARKHYIAPARKEAPLWAFTRSLYEPSIKQKLLHTPLPAATKAYFEERSKPLSYTPVSGADAIDNIIVFVSESTPASLTSVNGGLYASTPNLEKWSNMGRNFSNMYAHIPSTPNSMLSLVAGVYPMIDFKSALVERKKFHVPGLPQVLAENGWNTSVFFSSDLSYSNMKIFLKEQGFATINDGSNLPCQDITHLKRADLNGMDDSCMVAQYLEWLDRNKGTKNFSLLWTNQTHIPYFTNTDVNYTGRKDNLNRYLNALHHTDDVFGNMMQALAQKNLLERTLVIFLADHGEAFGSHDQKSHGSRIYEENMHIPLLLINPRLFKGEKDSAIQEMVDIAPTIAHVAGLPKGAGWQGTSLLAGGKNNRSFFVSPYTDLLVGTRSNNWKYIFNVNNGEQELYDLEKDPKELYNVGSKHPKIVAAQHLALTGWFQYVDGQYRNGSSPKQLFAKKIMNEP